MQTYIRKHRHILIILVTFVNADKRYKIQSHMTWSLYCTEFSHTHTLLGICWTKCRYTDTS